MYCPVDKQYMVNFFGLRHVGTICNQIISIVVNQQNKNKKQNSLTLTNLFVFGIWDPVCKCNTKQTP